MVAVYFLLLKLMPPAEMVIFSVFLFLSLFNKRNAKARKGSEEEKETWMTIINSTLMSSDSSGEEGEVVIIVHPIPWVSADVVAFKKNSKKLRRRKVHRPVVK